jgi:hypothetical protein
MTDVSPQPEFDESSSVQDAPAPLPPAAQEKIDAIRAQIQEEDAVAAAAEKTETDRLDAMDTAKAMCVAACGPISVALQASTDPRERQALIELENEIHAVHAAALEQAHLIFSGQRAGESNPAAPGATTPLTAAVVVTSDTQL